MNFYYVFPIFADQASVITIPIPPKGPKVTSLLWGNLDETLITGHENGDIVQWDVKEHQKTNMDSTQHKKSISDLQLSPDGKKWLTYISHLVKLGKIVLGVKKLRIQFIFIHSF